MASAGSFLRLGPKMYNIQKACFENLYNIFWGDFMCFEDKLHVLLHGFLPKNDESNRFPGALCTAWLRRPFRWLHPHRAAHLQEPFCLHSRSRYGAIPKSLCVQLESKCNEVYRLNSNHLHLIHNQLALYQQPDNTTKWEC